MRTWLPAYMQHNLGIYVKCQDVITVIPFELCHNTRHNVHGVILNYYSFLMNTTSYIYHSPAHHNS